MVSDAGLKFASQAGEALQDAYPQYRWTLHNRGVGGTGSWWALLRLQGDAVDLRPEVVVLDFTVNDYDHPHHRRQAEALIRRLRAELPGARLAAVLFLQVADPEGQDPANLKEPVRQAWLALCAHYGVPYADYAAEVQRAAAAGERSLGELFADPTHPNDAGHTLAAQLLGAVLGGGFLRAGMRPLPAERCFDNGEYEHAPLLLDADQNAGLSGSWTPAGSGLTSSQPGAAIAFEAVCQSFGLDCNYGEGAALVEYRVDGGEWSRCDYAAAGVNYHCLWTGERGEHRAEFRVVEGSFSLGRFLAI